MRKSLCLLILLLLSFAAQAQGTALASFNLWQAHTLRTGMLLLGAWAIGNIVFGSFKLTKATRSRKYFFQMNVYWNVVNLCIAALALYSILSKDVTAQSLVQSLRRQELYIKALYLNVGLDVAYLVLGAYLKERSRTSSTPERHFGWGQSIGLQGLFLLLLDTTLTVLLELHNNTLLSLLPSTG